SSTAPTPPAAASETLAASAPAPTGSPPPFFWDVEAAGTSPPPSSVPLDEIVEGGPPPDGIPPIDDPAYETIAEADEWLEDREPVMVVEVADAARAYPLRLLTYHEIVNDSLGGRPVLVTYCPLCNSGLVFNPVVDGRTLDFGTSGRLWRSNLVMYDRATHSLWSQFTGEAIVGTLLGTQLERLPSAIVSWETFKRQWPGADVLSRDTGHSRPYGNNPYVGYDGGSPFLFDGDTGGPLPQMARVVAVTRDAAAVAVPLDRLRDERVVAAELDGQPLVVFWAPGTASALDTEKIAEGADVGATGVFSPVVDGKTLRFTAAGDGFFVDDTTGSRWNLVGKAVAGPLDGERLARIAHDDTFWFVQYAFRPDTRVEQS
ncbi:MAG: DUF3179 domain-containing protein, partial [Actinomycetota bacterium]|nr:DUF3179 domain-containing protein [Actinomycetota bacterium]